MSDNSPRDRVESTATVDTFIPTVLLVDDQETARTVLATLVRSVAPGAVVQAFSDAPAALAWAREHEADLVLTDVRMGEMDGITFTRRLREIAAYDRVPIVVVTVADETEIRYAALEAGATDFINKPIDAMECRTRCRNLLILSRQHRLMGEYVSLLEAKLRRAENLMRTMLPQGADASENEARIRKGELITVDYDALFQLTSVVQASEILLREAQASIAHLEAGIGRPLHGRPETRD